MVKNVQEK